MIWKNRDSYVVTFAFFGPWFTDLWFCNIWTWIFLNLHLKKHRFVLFRVKARQLGSYGWSRTWFRPLCGRRVLFQGLKNTFCMNCVIRWFRSLSCGGAVAFRLTTSFTRSVRLRGVCGTGAVFPCAILDASEHVGNAFILGTARVESSGYLGGKT